MDVTSQNFKEVLPTFKKALGECHYVSIDTELTGLDTPSLRINNIDSVEERFLKLRTIAGQFLIIQFGVTTFKYVPSEKKLLCQAFNFYVFPQRTNQFDIRFICQSSSMRFLAANKFDFNKLIYHGIPFLTKTEENTVQEQQNAAALQSPQKNSSVELKPEDKEFVATVLGKIEDWVTGGAAKPLVVDSCNPYQRRILFQEVPKVYDLLLTSVRDKNQMIFQKNSEENTLKQKKTQQDDLENAVGFRYVIDALVSARKPVLGHNMLLDLLHLYAQFLAPLPESLTEFKAKLHNSFPLLFDTKHLLTQHEKLVPLYSSTMLEDAYKISLTDKFPQTLTLEFVPGYGDQYATSGIAHNAGYDAFMTGAVFARASAFLGQQNETPVDLFLPKAGVLNDFANRINIARSSVFMNVCGEDVAVDRSTFLHVSGFSREFKTEHLIEQFKEFGPVRTYWIDDASLYCSIEDETKRNAALAHFQRDSGLLKVVSFAAFQESASRKRRSSAANASSGSDMAIAAAAAAASSTPSSDETKEGASSSNKKLKVDNVPVSDN